MDESTVIYLKKDYAPQVPPLDAGRVMAERGITPSILQEAPVLLQIPRPPAWSLFWEDFYKPTQYSIGLKTIATYFSYTGRFEPAEMTFLENIRRTEGRYYDLYIGLGSLYYNTRRTQEARMCLERDLAGYSPGGDEQPEKPPIPSLKS